MKLLEKKDVSTNKVELTISVSAEEFDKGLEAGYKKQVKSISVPGFRKGKAPRKMIEKIYGDNVFFEDAVNSLYQKALTDAIIESELEVVAHPEIEIKDVSKEEGFTFTALCTVKPEINVTNYKGIEVEKPQSEVTAEDIDSRIESMRKRGSRMVDVEDRKTQNGDTVVFDFAGSIDGVPFDGGTSENFSLELGSGQFIAGFEPQLENREIGDEFDVEVTFPDDYHMEKLRSQPAVFSCKINEVKMNELPELDDEFAKDVSEFDTLDELKKDLEVKIKEQKEKSAEADLENAIIDKVIENIEGEIPEEMYDVRIDEMVQDFAYRLQSQGMDVATYMQYTGMDKDAFRLTFKEQAIKQVKIRLALEKIVEIENIEVTEDELTAELQKIADMHHTDLDKIKSMVPEADIKKDVAANKAVEIIKSSAVVK